MNVARHHNEWLSLVEVSGPFLSLPVLLRVFPQGLDSRDPSQASRLRDAYEDWLERGAKVPAVHHAWIRHVLDDVLAYPANLLAEGQAIPPGLDAVMATFNETLRPDLVLKHRETDQKPILLVSVYPPSQDLQKPVSGKLWKASPGTRMMEVLHAADVPMGLVTNGEEWMLVFARRNETTGFASWHADLWMQEPLTLRAFHSLLHLRRLIGVPAPATLPGLLIESSKDQQEVTDQLGYQVRDAVEVLVQAFDRIDAESGRTLLANVDEKTLYDGALTVMMRLVFLFSAEERGLLLLGDPLYDQNYAVSTLSQLLREQADQHGEEVLERRHDAWCRLLATFRAVHAGVEHEAMRLPPYGGTLFDPDRYPFLEGRTGDGGAWPGAAAKPLVINNRVVLHLLEALQVLRVRVPGGGPAEARRLSFSALDIEQIGHVYEGLLDHTAKRALDPILGLAGSKDKEPEVPLQELEELAREGTAALTEFLHDETGRSVKALTRLLEESTAIDAHAVLIACGQDERVAQRVMRFAPLLRTDSFGRLVVIGTGGIYVASGNERRNTGTHYTPRSLTEPIVRHALEPLIYEGPREGLPESEWSLKSAKEILALKVCDMAMGSGAFLVQACRYLSERLVEAWENSERELPGSFVVTPDGELATGSPAERLLPTDLAERVTIARRYVADRCLYGVDINPMAVEMAKLSLWLTTLQRDRPFTFLDHALREGDSLLGVSSLTQVENFSLQLGERQVTFATANLLSYVQESLVTRSALEKLPSNSYEQIETKARLHAEATGTIAQVKALADALIAFELCGFVGDRYEGQRSEEAERVRRLMSGDDTLATLRPEGPRRSRLQSYADDQLRGRRPFHWPVEFPEVCALGGFDVFVGNPPYLGGQKLTGAFGEPYREYLVSQLAQGKRGSADLCSYFLLRASSLLSRHGILGFVVTSAVAEGDSRDVGLGQMVRNGTIIRTGTRQTWSGAANVTFATVWFATGAWSGSLFLGDVAVAGITPSLGQAQGVEEKPYRLAVNSESSFQGCIILGKGFLLTAAEAEALVQRSRKNGDVIWPYLIGEEINSSPVHSGSMWIINFGDWPLDETSQPSAYVGPVAADYRDCLAIVRDKVKPDRDKNPRKARRERWWQYAEKAVGLYKAIEGLKWSLAIATGATKYVAFAKVTPRTVFSHALAIIATDSHGVFACLSSSLHDAWARRHGSYNLLLLRYAPSDLYETFPMPTDVESLSVIGQAYYEHRADCLRSRGVGLTDAYNSFHDRREMASDILRLRTLQVDLDQAVATAYGWSDVPLGHDFHETKQGVRYTLSERARQVILERLLALNHQRFADEVSAGRHKKTAKPARVLRKGEGAIPRLFGDL